MASNTINTFAGVEGRMRSSRCEKHKKTCGCPACRGLACLERPRFFAGQLLTEAELNGEQAYQMAKNRLQNRYLHGWGVACGLEVSCSDCEGQVRIHEGYAIDPCGNDIIVCEDTTFDVIQAIRDCCQRRTRKRDDCDPYEPPPPKGCDEAEQTWCITVEYQEKPMRPVTPLKPPKKTCGCGCGGECACGKDKNDFSGSATAHQTGTATKAAISGAAACEPTRILETYKLGVMEEPEWCKNPVKEAIKSRYVEGKRQNALNLLLSLVPENSLLRNIIACWQCAFEILAGRVRTADWQILMLAAQGQLSPNQTTPAELHAAVCRLRDGVVDLFTENPYNVRCQLIKTLGKIDIPVPATTPGSNLPPLGAYQTQVAPAIRDLLTMIVQYLLDCICQAFVPRCSPDPVDDRVILACVTVKGGKILRICQFGCRKYAGSFPSLYYWLSALPVGPILSMLLELLCCAPDLVRSNSPLVNDLFRLIDRLDPQGEKSQALIGNNFAGAKILEAMVNTFAEKVTFKKVRDILAKGFEDTSNLNRLVGRDQVEVESELARAKAKVVYRNVTTDSEARISPGAAISVTREGDEVLAYVKQGKVIGFARYSAEERLRDKEAEVDRMLNEMKSLRADLEKYRRT